MSFIGIITETKNKKYILNSLKNKIKCENILFITKSNINNIRNIKFSIIVINKNIDLTTELKTIINNAGYILINEDIASNYYLIKNMNLKIITYGYNPKSTITASSTLNDELLISIQRSISDLQGNKIEVQEISTQKEKYLSVYDIMFIKCIKMIYKN